MTIKYTLTARTSEITSVFRCVALSNGVLLELWFEWSLDFCGIGIFHWPDICIGLKEFNRLLATNTNREHYA